MGDDIDDAMVCEQQKKVDDYFLASAAAMTENKVAKVTVYCPAKWDSLFLLPSSDEVIIKNKLNSGS